MDKLNNKEKAENNTMLATGLSPLQKLILKLIKNFGAEIQIDFNNGKYEYAIVEIDGNVDWVLESTFLKLKNNGFISLKWKPSINTERWA